MTVAVRNSFKFEMPSITEMQHLVSFCKVMSEAPFYAKLGAGGVLAIYMTAKERNLPFMSCLNGGLHAIEGKITFSGGMVAAMILNAGHDYKVLTNTENECEILFVRGDRGHDKTYQPQTFKYTISDAKRAGYLGKWDAEGKQVKAGKDNWIQNPKAMLFNRCVMGGMRLYMPEIAVGVLVAGELTGTEADGSLDIAQDVKPATIEAPQQETPPVLQIDHVKVESFKEKYGIGKDTDYDKYLDAISIKCSKPKEDLIVSGSTNPEGFENAFNKWNAKQQPKEVPVEPQM